MRNSTLDVETSGGALRVDAGIAAVAEFAPTPLGQSGRDWGTVGSPALLLPVDDDALEAFGRCVPARIDVNAVLFDDTLLPILVPQSGHAGIALTFETDDRGRRRLPDAARSRGWLPMCLRARRRSMPLGTGWPAEADDVGARLGAQPALAPTQYVPLIAAALRGAVELLRQPAELQPQHVSLRILASGERLRGSAGLAATMQAESVH